MAASSREKQRLMVRVSDEAKERLRQHAAQLSGQKGRTVSMASVLEELLLKLPLNRRSPGH